MQDNYKKIVNLPNTAEHLQNYPYLLQKYEKIGKKSSSSVFEIANNFIAEIQFIAHRLAKKEMTTLQALRNTLNLP